MDFSVTDEQISHCESVVEFARTQLVYDVVKHDQQSCFPAEPWMACADFGLFGWVVPRDLGGSGYSVTATTQMMESLGYGCADNGLAFAIGAQIWSVQMALLHFASPQQLDRYLPSLIKGKSKACFAITEAGSGSDAFSLSTLAVKDGSDYLLSGEKIMITMAPQADFAVLFAVTDSKAGQWGVTAFLVDLDRSGVCKLKNDSKMGLRTVPFGSITLDNCRVPSDMVLGREGAGLSIFNYSQGWERSLVLAPQVGAMRRQLEDCVSAARTNKRAGKTIGKHQAVSHRIADMAIRLEASQLLLRKTAWLMEQGKQSLREAAITKTFISEAFVKSSEDAIAIHGGSGYMTETGIERDLRDALGATIYGGTVDIQRNIIAGLNGL